MCNPRRVKIQLERAIEEAWRESVEQTATLGEEVTEQARIMADISLEEELGPLALEVLEQVLGGEFESIDAWERDAKGNFRRELDRGTLVYDPQTHQIGIEAQITQQITAEARGVAEASGFTVGEVATEAIGRYYDDGWGGRTKEVALKEAQQKAEENLQSSIQQLHRQEHAKELAEAEAEAQAQAQEEAQKELKHRREEARAAMREQLQVTMAQAQDEAFGVINRVVGETYRQTLKRIVLENGGEILQDEETGSVINMELEIY